jgi:hypothetical protein
LLDLSKLRTRWETLSHFGSADATGGRRFEPRGPRGLFEPEPGARVLAVGHPRDPPDPDGAPFGEQPDPAAGSRSTSQPHPDDDIEAYPVQAPERDKLDD